MKVKRFKVTEEKRVNLRPLITLYSQFLINSFVKNLIKILETRNQIFNKLGPINKTFEDYPLSTTVSNFRSKDPRDEKFQV